MTTAPELTICVICGGGFTGYGHNPAPVAETGRCCGFCNDMEVIPARLRTLPTLGSAYIGSGTSGRVSTI